MAIKQFIDKFEDRADARKKMADAIGTSESAVRSWANGNRKPKVCYLPALVKYTGLTREQLRPDIYGNS